MNTLKKTKEILSKYNISANKRFGQNFLIDDNILSKIVEVSNISPNDLVIEIGPGLGNLTSYLLDVAKHVLLVEIDNNMIDILTERFSNKTNYTLLNEDILKVDLDSIVSKLESDIKTEFNNVLVVANLPYYITTPILFKLLQDSKRVTQITVMVQKEVACRMVASKNTKDYSILTLMTNYLADSKIEVVVPNFSFIPAPNVTSAVIRLVKKKKYNCSNEEILFKLIHCAFAQRRKKMINSLESTKFLNLKKEEIKDVFKSVNYDENIRAEQLGIEEYILLCEAFLNR